MRFVRLLAGKSMLMSRERKKNEERNGNPKTYLQYKTLSSLLQSFPVLDKMPQHRLTTVTFSICRQELIDKCELKYCTRCFCTHLSKTLSNNTRMDEGLYLALSNSSSVLKIGQICASFHSAGTQALPIQ